MRTRREVPAIRRTRVRRERLEVEGRTSAAAFHAFTEAGVGAVVAPTPRWVRSTLRAGEIKAALGCVFAALGAAFRVRCRPFSALAVGETGYVGVLVDASAFVLTPDAFLLGAIQARSVFSTHLRTRSLLQDVSSEIRMKR